MVYMKRKNTLSRKVPASWSIIILLFLFFAVLLTTYVSIQRGSYDYRASAYPPNNASNQTQPQQNGCRWWCAGCNGFCGDDGVGQGKTCNTQQFERCGQLPCYVTGTCSSQSNSNTNTGTGAGTNVQIQKSSYDGNCTCDNATCGEVHDNTSSCKKFVCLESGWKEVGIATHKQCVQDTRDNGTCGDGACSNGESIDSCSRDCTVLFTTSPTDCTCDNAHCGEVHDNTASCKKFVCLESGWKEVGIATHRQCAPGTIDNGTCGDGACSNGETLSSCARDCATLFTSTAYHTGGSAQVPQTDSAASANYSNRFFAQIAQYYGLNILQLRTLFEGGLSLFNSLLRSVSNTNTSSENTSATPSQQEDLFRFAAGVGCSYHADGVPLDKCLEQAKEYNKRYHDESGRKYRFVPGTGCVEDQNGVLMSQCLEQAEEYLYRNQPTSTPTQRTSVPNEGTYGLVDGACVPQRGTMLKAACELLIRQ